MQTETRAIRVILAEVYGGNHKDQKHVDTADRIYEAVTGKKNPKRDPVAGWLGMSQENEARMKEVTAILNDFEFVMRRKDDIAGNSIWQDFARGFVRKERDLGHDYHTWLTWYMSEPRRAEWAWKETPTTIRAKWLMAFPVQTNTITTDKDGGFYA